MIAIPTTELFNPTCIYFYDPIFFVYFYMSPKFIVAIKAFDFISLSLSHFFNYAFKRKAHTHIKYLSLLLRTLYCYTVIITVITTDITMIYTAEV